jgi:TPR repeat protein
MILMSHAYENGLGVPKDRGQAVFWLEQASRAGDKDAGEALAGLEVSW